MKRPTPISSSFLNGYLECALWSSTDASDNDRPLDDNYGTDDFAPSALTSAIIDCNNFIEANSADLDATGASMSQHGHDFWLTRNRHGAGFWDRGYGAVGDRLSDAAHVYGSVDLYADGGKVHGE